MPAAQSGTPGTIVPPTKPEQAHDADTANPGEVETAKANERASKTGKYGSQPVTPHENVPPDEPDKKVWVEVQLIDDADQPVPGAKFTVTLPNGRVHTSTTDKNGVGYVQNLDPGNVDISFPDLDQEAWEPA